MTRRQAQKDWFAIARTPTWLGRLVVALALAAIFALLGQWQLGRALPAANPTPTATSVIPGSNANLSTFTVSPNPANFAVIAGRLQPGGKSGFWLVTNSQILKSQKSADVGRDLTIAWGWAATADAALSAQKALDVETLRSVSMRVSGVLTDAEAPLQSHPDKPYLFDSLSLGQLINFYQPFQQRKTLGQYLISQPVLASDPISSFGLEPIMLGTAPSAPLDNVNWLSAFYAIEWSVFAGFAVFMWWRLVEDERLRRKADDQAQS